MGVITQTIATETPGVTPPENRDRTDRPQEGVEAFAMDFHTDWWPELDTDAIQQFTTFLALVIALVGPCKTAT